MEDVINIYVDMDDGGFPLSAIKNGNDCCHFDDGVGVSCHMKTISRFLED